MKSSERIRIVNGYEKNAYTYIPVVIVGAGAGGIGMACQLKEQLGFDQFRIFDRQAGLGGTWWINRYPGIACDVPTPFYSFSFRPNKEATELYPSGRELIRYFQQVASEYGVIDKISLNTDVKEVRWLESEKLWEMKIEYLASGMGDLPKKERERIAEEKGRSTVYIGSEMVRAKVVVSACGGLVEPSPLPAHIPGWEDFKGTVMHTARWDREIDLSGKDVIVVGSGCSAAQTVPNLVKPPYNVKSATQIMRTAPWVCPKQQEPFGKESYAAWAPWLYKNIPGFHSLVRYAIAGATELDFLLWFGGSEKDRLRRKKLEQQMIARMKRRAPEKYHDMLTPNFELGCKRRIFDEAWHRCLNDSRIRLTTQKLVSVGEDSVTLEGGGKFPEREDDPTGQTPVTLHADAIVLATGFDTATWLHPLKVVGRDGADLHEVWQKRGGAQAYMGSAMDGFPNFFIVFGPNTATGHTSVIYTSENQINYNLKIMRRILSGEAETAEVRKHAEIEYTARIQRQLQDTVFAKGGCVSWYYETESGWNSTTYPRSQWDYQLRCMFPRWGHWDVQLTSWGLFRQRLRILAKTLAFVLAVVGYRRLKAAGITRHNLPIIVKTTGKMALVTLIGSVVSMLEDAQEKILS